MVVVPIIIAIELLSEDERDVTFKKNGKEESDTGIEKEGKEEIKKKKEIKLKMAVN